MISLLCYSITDAKRKWLTATSTNQAEVGTSSSSEDEYITRRIKDICGFQSCMLECLYRILKRHMLDLGQYNAALCCQWRHQQLRRRVTSSALDYHSMLTLMRVHPLESFQQEYCLQHRWPRLVQQVLDAHVQTTRSSPLLAPRVVLSEQLDCLRKRCSDVRFFNSAAIIISLEQQLVVMLLMILRGKSVIMVAFFLSSKIFKMY